MDQNTMTAGENAAVSGQETLAMLFTDIEGSTVLLQHLGERFDPVLMRHYELLRAAIAPHNGTEISTKGDALFATFPTARDAVCAAIEAQRLLQTEPWAGGTSLRVRMGIHFGAARRVADDYTGIDVHRAARISAAGHGGQIVLSQDCRDALGADPVADGVTIRPLGRHRLKDLRFPETLFDIVVPGLMQDFGSVRSLSGRPTNLADDGQHLMGREAEAARLRGLLTDPNRRIISLVGTGGIGKSTLARGVALRAMDMFPDGVYFVQLGGISNPALVMPTVAQTLGVHDFPGRPVVQDVIAAIGEGRQLLVLDTLEHVLGASAELARLVAECPNLNLLVTSRAALGLRSEVVVELDPLPLPNERASLAEISQAPSVQLFVARVREFDPDFNLDTENAPTIARICRRLEGIPLAIELGAARVKALSPARLLERLTERLGVLKGGRRDAASRHRTLNDAIGWSDNLLTEEERDVFQKLGVFIGGFELEDAEEVLDSAIPQGADVLDCVESLVDKSLVRRRTVNGEPRFAMFDMIREYTQNALSARGELERMRGLHAEHFATIAETCGAHALNGDQRAYILRLFTDADNIRAALDHALSQRDLDTVSRIVYALHWYWISQALFTEAFDWLGRAIALADALGREDMATARLHEAACSLRMGAGDYVGGRPHGAEAKRIYETMGDADGAARISLTHSICATVAGEIEDPSPILMGAIEHFQERQPYYAGLGLILLGEGARMAGEFGAAEECCRNALEIMQGLNNVFWPGHMCQNIAHFYLAEKRWEEAAELLATAYDMAEDFDFPMVSNLCVAGLAGVALHRGDPRKAARIMGGVDRNLHKIGVEFEPTDKAAIESYATGARAALGDKEYEALMAEGAAMDWDDLRQLARRAAEH